MSSDHRNITTDFRHQLIVLYRRRLGLTAFLQWTINSNPKPFANQPIMVVYKWWSLIIMNSSPIIRINCTNTSSIGLDNSRYNGKWNHELWSNRWVINMAIPSIPDGKQVTQRFDHLTTQQQWQHKKSTKAAMASHVSFCPKKCLTVKVITSWWLNHPFEKILVKLDHFPKVGVKIKKNIWVATT